MPSLNHLDLTGTLSLHFPTYHTHNMYNTYALICTHTVVTLTYTIPSRPSARRPIPGETVVYTCEVEGTTLTWSNVLFQNDLTWVGSIHNVGEMQVDDDTGQQQDLKPRDLGAWKLLLIYATKMYRLCKYILFWGSHFKPLPASFRFTCGGCQHGNENTSEVWSRQFGCKLWSEVLSVI